MLYNEWIKNDMEKNDIVLWNQVLLYTISSIANHVLRKSLSQIEDQQDI